MYDSILVPLDGSAVAEQALPVASSIARLSDATLRLVHVHTPHHPIYVEGMPVIDESFRSRRKEHEQAYLKGVGERLASETGLTITCALLQGSVAETIAEYARSTGAGLIVMTTYGQGGFARAWLGSVTDALVRCSPTPILVVRPTEGAQDADRSPTFQRILIPLDGSGLAEQILAHALALGTLMQAEYTLLHVVQPAALGGALPAVFAPEVDPNVLQQGEAAAQDYLDGVAARLRTKGARVQTHVLVSSQPAAAILDDARQKGIELIAMASHGRSGLARLLLGSITDKVLRGADVPLLLYRPQEQLEDHDVEPAA